MSINPGLWAHLPGTHHGYFETVVADIPPPPSTRAVPIGTTPRARRGALVALVLGLVLVVLAMAPRDAEAQTTGTTRMTGVTQVATGARHGCARLDAGRVRCWGEGSNGALGNGTTSDSSVGTLVRSVSGPGSLTGVRQVVTGAEHSCALLTSTEVRCWGANDNGQLGDGTAGSPRITPAVVRGPGEPGSRLTGVTAISAGGDNTCAVLSGGVLCWGENEEGELGTGPATPYREIPTQVLESRSIPLSDVTQIDVGAHSSCARTSSGTAYCWGRNVEGQLGAGNTDLRRLAAPVRSGPDGGPLSTVTAVNVGTNHACARLASAQARCWGSNVDGRLGDGTVSPRLYPTPVVSTSGVGPLTGVRSVRAGFGTTCAHLTSGGVRCWGYGAYGTMGNGTTFQVNIRPVAVRNIAGTVDLTVTQLNLGELTACARLSNGQARCWGYGAEGTLGNGVVGEDSSRPVPVLQGPVVP